MSQGPSSSDHRALLRDAYMTLRELRAELGAVERAKTEPIAIVGMGCRLPGGVSRPEEYWRLLRDGVDAITEVPPERWDVDALYDPDPDAPGKMYSRHGGFLGEVGEMDPEFFGISPREAAAIDPQQRLLLEVAWEALEDAAKAPKRLIGSSTGVFVGLFMDDYSGFRFHAGDLEAVDAYNTLGAMRSMAAGRLAYILGLQGPVLQLDTACSSSLLAAHLACESLRSGACDLALAGGVNLILSPEASVGLSKMRAVAPDGRCKTFDARADGYVRGEGCGIMVLERLSDARANGDDVLALIRGSAVNHDGRSNGLTAPNGSAQEAVIRRAVAAAGVEPAEIQYVEAHGTGTLLGDPIETLALGATLGGGRSPDERFYLGSVKTNFGHLEAAAGVAGLMKVVLSLHHGVIPPHLHFEEPNPHIPWDEIPVEIPVEPTPWPADRNRRLAGISSFGMSGTNVHMILEGAIRTGAPKEETRDPETSGHQLARQPYHLMTLSARDERALRDTALRYEDYLGQRPETEIASLCFTARTGRTHFDQRAGLITDSIPSLREQLRALAAGETPEGVLSGRAPVDGPKIAFLFTGQGSQYAGMGRELFATQPVFRQTLLRCDEILRGSMERPLRSILYPENGEDASTIDLTGATQPTLFALEFALAELWKSWGVEPAAVLGHSIGEYVAACVAGILSLEEGLTLAANRGRSMQALPPGGEMAALPVSEERARQALGDADEVSIAAVNSPERVVISGAGAAVRKICEALRAEGVEARSLQVSHAFHSPLMEPMLGKLGEAASGVSFSPPSLPIVSNLTGRLVGSEMTRADYWVAQAREPVRFADGVTTLAAEGCDAFLEIGPKPTLLGLARHVLPAGTGVFLPSLRPGHSDWQRMLSSLGELYVRGVSIDAARLEPEGCRRLRVPTYPFQRRRCWLEPPAPKPREETGTAPDPAPGLSLLGRELRLAGTAQRRFERQVRRDAPSFLADHRVFGTTVVPATAYLEMAVAAGGGERTALREVAFERPLLLGEGETRHLQLVLTPADANGFSFEIFSLPAETADETPWTRHAYGEIRSSAEHAGEASSRPSDELEGLRADVTGEVEVADYYRSCRERGVDYGPGFQVIERLWQRQGERSLARVRLPATVESGEPEELALHPVLLDGCLQVLRAALPEESGDGTHLPVGCERLRILGRPAERGWCHARMRPQSDDRSTDRSDDRTLAGDLWLLDDDGELVLEITGLIVKRADRRVLQAGSGQTSDSHHTAEDDPFYRVEWREAARDPRSDRGPGEGASWLIFADREGFGRRLGDLLAARGGHPIFVHPGPSFEAGGEDEYSIDPGSPRDFERLLEECFGDGRPPCRGVVHLWSLDLAATDAPLEDQILGCGSVLHLVQALGAGQPSPLPGLWLMTRGAQAVTNEQLAPIHVAQSPLWGLARVIAVEHPGLGCRCLDLDPEADAGAAATAVAAELEAPDRENQVAMRGTTRWAPRLTRGLDRSSREPLAIREDRNYLITGGLGDLGLEVAGWMVKRGARHLILAGRSAPSEVAREAIARLERKGTRVRCVSLDVTDGTALGALLEEIAADRAALGGVVHAAGVLGDALLMRQDWESFERVLAPKVQGAWNLHTATAGLGLDFFVVFSSAVSLLGSPGQGNYAAANAFLDAVAHHRQALGLPGSSINWGLWGDTGMAAELSARERRRWSDLGVEAMRPERGLDALGRIFQDGDIQTAVIDVRWPSFLEGFFQGEVPPFFSELEGKPMARENAEPLSLADRLREAPPAERSTLLLGEIRSRAARILNLGSPEQIGDGQNLFDLGFDSMMAMELKNGLESSLGCELATTLVFDHPSPEEIERHLASSILVA